MGGEGSGSGRRGLVLVVREIILSSRPVCSNLLILQLFCVCRMVQGGTGDLF